ncbi:HCL313Cp [Eremothecium sinecaudum]|uniref:HCL313Cp n=1 Tax=Eremothecium sinecaudum TaxID=45286 RepID=A0A109UYL4_9SACH|nr:HCL313Cp [Eremothecium sinecaudum]AMD19838.1 HCL313Cp [Eremothecium sinecaudum]
MSRILREYRHIQKQLESYPSIISLQPRDDMSDIQNWQAQFYGPPNTPFENHIFTLLITVPDSYPHDPPLCKFPPKHVCHPNIKWSTGEICLDLLKHESWSPLYNLLEVVMAISTLLAEPGVESPLDVDLAIIYASDRRAYDALIKYRLLSRPNFNL